MGEQPVRIRCAYESALALEPLLATASRVQRWLLIEQPGPWGSEALHESRLDSALAEIIAERAAEARARVLLVRRPGWRGREGDRHTVFVAHTSRQGRWCERLDLDDTQLGELDLDVLRVAEAPGLGEPADSVHMVCTNGRHDPCCADLGRPVARALADDGRHDVWESSHVGGDRFAANVVVLPTGVYLGRVPPAEAVTMLEELDDGWLHLDHYRGRSFLSTWAQAAEIFIRRHLDERRLDAVEVLGAAESGKGARAVRLRVDGREFTAEVTRERGAEQILTCDATQPSRPWRYHLHSVT